MDVEEKPESTHVDLMEKWIVWDGSIAQLGVPIPDPKQPLQLKRVLSADYGWRVQAGRPVFAGLDVGLVGSVLQESRIDAGWIRVKMLLMRQLVEEYALRTEATALYPAIGVDGGEAWDVLADGTRKMTFTNGTVTRLALTKEPTWAGVDPVWKAPPPRGYVPPPAPLLFAEATTVARWMLVPAGIVQQLEQLQMPSDELGVLAGRLVENAVGLHEEGRCPANDPNCPEPGGHDHDGCKEENGG